MRLSNMLTVGALSAIVTLAAAPGGSAAGQPKSSMKCWTNRDGVRECGNAVPPEYIQQGHTKLNAQGVEVGQQGRAKTSEEIQAEKRDVALKQEEERKAKELAAANRVLLDTFSSEDDLVFAREGQLSAIEGQIRLTESRIQKLQAGLDHTVSFAAELERNGKQPSEKMEANVNSVRQQIEQQRAFIEGKRTEQEVLKQKFDADLQRFRELTAKR